ncbi:MAG: DNA gyrase subunit A [Anaerolineae bacterium]|nr:MAG: DNA gyrase subunit A [Chloroflexi bacterium OLB13]MBV6435945.1 DNA gyrase subunit A [Anaerolineae bacterium]MBW7879562.1 DNA gyrase subunit A [Anaerolineae bacterium]GIK27651.1 MAG: DNA gyrase subunit A [Chloroflexota bacterium]
MDNGHTRQITIEQEMRDAYIDYAMSVIVSRALPDARDGLKPVHRRILYAMYDMGVRANTPYKKSARIVGEVLGKYHPHGDGAVYESLVRMAQNFAMRYTLVDGQGNFGSIDGDSAAAMRYTEARMAEVGDELMADIDKDTVDFGDNFDGSLQEPLVLPSTVPNLLVNGATGIAVGMSTNIPPHNLGEVVDALIYMLDRWDSYEDLTTNDLMQFIKGPDFPTGGLVYHHEDGVEEDGDNPLVSAYATGRGKITIRAKAHIEDMGRGKQRIIVTELPYQVNKTSLVERIAYLVREGKLEGLSDLRDESDRQGLRLVIELQRGVDAAEVLARMYKLTQLQETFGIIMLALVHDEPRILSLKQMLRVYLDHRLEIVRRRSVYDLGKARARAHILEGLLKAIDAIDKVIRTIRSAADADAARQGLIKLLGITDEQAQAILDMQLRRLAALERAKIQEEYDEKLRLIAYLEGLLESQPQMRGVIAQELRDVRAAYGDKRRTVIVDSTAGVGAAEALFLPEEPVLLAVSHSGRIARMTGQQAPRVAADVKDPPRELVEGSGNHVVYLVTTRGQCATVPMQQIPELEDIAGAPMFHELCPLSSSDELAAVLSLPAGAETGYLFMATTQGLVKRIRLSDLPGLVMKPFTVMNVAEDDALGWAFTTTGANDILLSSSAAQAIRFSEKDVRPTGLPAGGMKGIKLPNDRARVVSAHAVTDGQYVVSVSDDAVAKLSAVSDYPQQGRAGGGVITMRLPKSSRELAAAGVIDADGALYLLSNRGKAVKLSAKRIPQVIRGRPGGDILMSMDRKDEQIAKVVTVTPRFVPPDPVDENGGSGESDEAAAEPAAEA